MPSPSSEPHRDASYAPHAVPPPTCAVPSIRDNVRRTLLKHDFRPSLTHYTELASIYASFLSDHSLTHSAALETKFRSALGRVLRPPFSADEFAQSFAARGVRRWKRRFIGLVGRDVPCVLLSSQVSKLKFERGRELREQAEGNEEVRRLQETRKKKRREAARLPEEEATQHVFPNGKELAESMSAFSTVRSHLVTRKSAVSADEERASGRVSFDDTNVVLLAIGDGVTPRTAALFAFRSEWRCMSIDPAMRTADDDGGGGGGAWAGVRNLSTVARRVQDVTVRVARGERVVLVLWHAHVSVADAVACLRFHDDDDENNKATWQAWRRERVAVVACFCCNFEGRQRRLPCGAEPDAEFEEIGVPGLMRTVRVWEFQRSRRDATAASEDADDDENDEMSAVIHD